MQFLRTLKRETLVDIIDGVLSLIVLALSVEMFKAWSSEAGHLVQISTAFFLSLAGYRFIHAFLIRADSKMDFIRDIIAGCLLLVCTILLIAKGNGPNVMTTVGKLYFTVILVEAFCSSNNPGGYTGRSGSSSPPHPRHRLEQCKEKM